MKQLEKNQMNAVKGGVNKRDKAHGTVFSTKSTPK